MDNQPVIIITGASRGIGAAAACSAAQSGANLVLAARSAGPLKMVAESIRQAGGNALALAEDVSRVEDCQDLVEKALDRYGRIDALVNNAGRIEPIGFIAQADPQEWRRNWEVNLLGPLALTQAVLPELRKRSGRVINLSSGTSTAVIQGWGAYSTAKAALDHLTRILAAEEEGITAVVFRPGIVDTDMQSVIRATGRRGMAESDYNRLVGLHTQGKLIPASVAGKAVAVLALHAPHEWSGQTIQWDEDRLQDLSNKESI